MFLFQIVFYLTPRSGIQMSSEHFTLVSCCAYLEPQWPLVQAKQGSFGFKVDNDEQKIYVFCLAILVSYYKDPVIESWINQ